MHIKLLMFFVICAIPEALTLISSKSTVVTGKVTQICVFFREKDLAIDDFEMPDILTFCSCVVVHKLWVLTARQCYVQLDWYVSVVTVPFTKTLPTKLHNIEYLHDMDELTMVKISPVLDVEPIELSQDLLQTERICQMYGFTTPDRKPVEGNKFSMLHKVWHMEGDLIQVDVKVTSYEVCAKKYPRGLSEYKSNFTLSTMCVDPMDDSSFEPCAFDRGAPILCDGKLIGVLIYQRPLPRHIPLHLPVGCYGHFAKKSLYAEIITPVYHLWMSNCIQKQNTSFFDNLIHKVMFGG